jgi:hypothetical protein
VPPPTPTLTLGGGLVATGAASTACGPTDAPSALMIHACSSSRPSVSISIPRRSARTWYAADTRAPAGCCSGV